MIIMKMTYHLDIAVMMPQSISLAASPGNKRKVVKRMRILGRGSAAYLVGVTLDGWRGPLKQLPRTVIDKPCSFKR